MLYQEAPVRVKLMSQRCSTLVSFDTVLMMMFLGKTISECY